MLCVLLPLTERMLVVLRDGRKIIGMMRSFDQFANIVLEEAVERLIVGKQFADVPLGLYVIRGENVVLLGEMVRAPCNGTNRAACPRKRSRTPRVLAPPPPRRHALPLPRHRTTGSAAAWPQLCRCLASLCHVWHRSQDDAKEATTTTELLSEAPVEEVLEAKRKAEEEVKLKASLSRKLQQDPWEVE